MLIATFVFFMTSRYHYILTIYNYLLFLYTLYHSVRINHVLKMLNIYYQNVRGLRTNTSCFYRNICLNSFDIISLTETWLLEGIKDSELFDNRYVV